MNQNVLNALKEQINQEFYSAYLYLAMSMCMESKNYKGYANWLFKQYQEELDHAHQFISYIQKRGDQVQLQDIQATDVSAESPLEIANRVLKHEQHISASINKVTEVTRQENDYATEIFLHAFISEQIEEEDAARDIVDRFTLAGDDVAAQYAVDKELYARQ